MMAAAVKAITRVEVYAAADGHRFRVRAANGKIISTGEAYTRKHDCVRGAKRANPGLIVVERAGKSFRVLAA